MAVWWRVGDKFCAAWVHNCYIGSKPTKLNGCKKYIKARGWQSTLFVCMRVHAKSKEETLEGCHAFLLAKLVICLPLL